MTPNTVRYVTVQRHKQDTSSPVFRDVAGSSKPCGRPGRLVARRIDVRALFLLRPFAHPHLDRLQPCPDLPAWNGAPSTLPPKLLCKRALSGPVPAGSTSDLTEHACVLHLEATKQSLTPPNREMEMRTRWFQELFCSGGCKGFSDA